MVLAPGKFAGLVGAEKAECLRLGPDGFNASAEAAKRICQECTITQECLEYALAHGEVGGVWGGLDDEEREAYARGTGQTALADTIKQALQAANEAH